MTIRPLIVAACFAIGGCSTLSDYGSVRKEALKNDQGHVIGYKEMLRNQQTGEVLAQVSLFAPVFSESGEQIGYEEQVRDGSIIRDFNGRPIGSRWTDLRSRSTNAKSKGIMVVYRPADGQQVALTQPKIWQLMASLSASDLRRIQ
jgi:hypothetical protein